MPEKFSIKTSSVSCFPNWPANGYNANSMKLFTKWEPLFTPQPALAKRLRYIVGANTSGNNCPGSLGCAALKKEMRNIFLLIKEKTEWATNLFSSQ
jgi:hypothetical protein